MILARKIKEIQGFSSDLRYVEAFSGHSLKFRQNLGWIHIYFFSNVTLLLFLAPFHFFSLLPHIFLVIDNQRSFGANRHEDCKILTMSFENLTIILWNIANIRDEKLLNCWCRRGAKECKSGRSRQELSNEYYLQILASIHPRKRHLIFIILAASRDLIFTERSSPDPNHDKNYVYSCPLRLASLHLGAGGDRIYFFIT